MTSSCDRCESYGECNFASVASNNRMVRHQLCGTSREYWCCPTEINGKTGECAGSYGRCEQGRSWGFGGVMYGSLIPILFIGIGISACFYMRRRQRHIMLIQMQQQQHGTVGPGNIPYAQQGGAAGSAHYDIPYATPAAQEGQYRGAYGGGGYDGGAYGQQGYGQQGGRSGLGAGGAAALGVGGGLIGGMMLASAFDGGGDGGGYGGDGGGGGGGDGGGDF